LGLQLFHSFGQEFLQLGCSIAVLGVVAPKSLLPSPSCATAYMSHRAPGPRKWPPAPVLPALGQYGLQILFAHILLADMLDLDSVFPRQPFRVLS
jgi:hypothetical protein